MISARQIALDCLIRIEREKSYPNLLLAERLTALQDARDRAFCTELVYGTTERRITLDHFITSFLSMPFRKLHIVTKNVLRMGAYQILYTGVPVSAACNTAVDLSKKNGQAKSAGLVNAVLRKIAVSRDKITIPQDDVLQYLSIFYSVDPSIVSLLVKQYGREFVEKYFSELSERPKDRSFVAVNTLLTTSACLIDRLSEEGVMAEPVGEDLLQIRFTDAVDKLPSYREGLFHFIGRESYEAVKMLSVCPGQSVLDCCSAPGGKTFLMAYKMQNEGEILAVDIHESKIRRMKEQAERLHIRNITFKVADASARMPEQTERFDRILCDVPCSGLGMIAKKPDLRYRDMSNDFSLHDTQRCILRNALQYIKKDGIILYSTCTVNKEENEQIVREVCKGYTVTDRLFLPQTDGTDGFYAACIEK